MARRRKVSPIGVSRIPRARRSNSGPPSSRSSSCTLRVSAGCDSVRSRAAARRLPRLAMAITSRSWFSFMGRPMPKAYRSDDFDISPRSRSSGI